MTNQEHSLLELKASVKEMMEVVETQFGKAYDAFCNMDKDLAREIIHFEPHVNAMEIKIDRQCENFFALYSPVAIDLRFVIATLKINSNLERIGDHAEGIAKYILDDEMAVPLEAALLEAISYHEMFTTASSMVEDAINSFLQEDTQTARWIFGKDSILNKINRKMHQVIIDFSKKNPDKMGQCLYLYSIMKKLERVGDLSKNIAEETIFIVDAKIIKHKKNKKLKKK